METSPVFVWRSTSAEPTGPNLYGRCIYCNSVITSRRLPKNEVDEITRRIVTGAEKEMYGTPLKELSEIEWKRVRAGAARHWEAWGFGSPETLDEEMHYFSEHHMPMQSRCARCGWWTNLLTANNIIGATYTLTAALRRFDVASSDLTTDEICSHLSRRFSDIYSVSPRRFEEVIAAVYRSIGWQVTLSKQSRDGGADLYCLEHTTGDICVVECKRYNRSRKVGITAVDRLLGVAFRTGARSAHLVTTSSFTKPATSARDLASEGGIEMELIDAHEVARLLNLYADKDLTLSDVEFVFSSEQ